MMNIEYSPPQWQNMLFFKCKAVIKRDQFMTGTAMKQISINLKD